MRAYREVRLSGLRTTPDAFGSTYDAEVGLADEHHAERLATSIIVGAFDDDRIVGVLGSRRREGPRESHKAFLWGFYVEPEHRRAGIASGLLNATLNALDAGVEQVVLTVVADNLPAIAIYERFGFRRFGVEPRSLKTSGVYADEALMVLFLTDRRSP